jgi:hypothetical protein
LDRIWIGIQPEVLDPDPESMNPDPKTLQKFNFGSGLIWIRIRSQAVNPEPDLRFAARSDPEPGTKIVVTFYD